MKVLFLGGDKRQLEIINNMHHQNNHIDVVGYDNCELDHDIKLKSLEEINIDNYDVILFPVDGVKDDSSITTPFNKEKVILPSDILLKSKKKALIFSGIKTKKLNEILKIAEKEVIVLMEDDTVKKENSIPTVEGIIGDLVYNTDVTINESNILILGYGNIGKLLANDLNYLGARITVGVIKESDYKDLKDLDRRVVYTNDFNAMKNAISNNEIIINTVPNIILNKVYLMFVKKGAYLLDVASYPYGIDFEQATNLGIKNKLASGIPAQVAPKTAGRILSRKINSIIRGGEK